MDKQVTAKPGRRVLRLLIVVLVAVVVFAAGSMTIGPLVLAGKEKVRRGQPVPGTPTMAALYAEQARKYLLPPDHRCLLAASVLQGWVTGQPEPATVAFDDVARVWGVSLGAKRIGQLPEVADFGDCATLLAALVPAGDAPAPAATPAAFTGPVELFRAAHALDDGTSPARWSGDRLHAMATAMVYLYAQSVDLAGIDDRLPAIAIALDALAGTSASRRALLAHLLGYRRAALKTAGALAEEDPVRLYVQDEDRRLYARARVPRPDPLARHLALRRHAERDDFTGWLELARTYAPEDRLDIPMWQTALIMDAFSQQRHAEFISRVIAGQMHAIAEGTYPAGWRKAMGSARQPADILALLETLGGGAATDTPVADVFEQGVGRFAGQHAGAVVDAALVRGFFQPYFYSTVQSAAVYKLLKLASIEAAEAWRSELERAGSAPARQFADWFAAMIAASKSGAKVEVLAGAMTRAPGRNQRILLFDLLARKHLQSGHRANAKYVRQLLAGLDGRPADVRYVGPELRARVHEFDLSEKLIRFSADNDTSRSAGWTLYLAGLLADADRLEQLAASADASPRDRRAAIDALGKLPGEPSPLLAELREAVVAAAPRDFGTVLWHSEFLVEQRRFDAARDHAQAWLALDLPDPGLQRVVMQVQVARAHFEEGSYDLAWAAIEPLLPSYHGGALTLAAKILGKLGQDEDADAVWRAYAERYPTSRNLDHLEYLWSKGRHTDAAASLKAQARGLPNQDWPYDIAPAFFRGTQAGGKAAAVAGIRALVAAGIPQFNLRYLTAPYLRASQPDIALAMRFALPPGSQLGQVEMLTEAYSMVRAVSGEEAAFDWLDGQIPFRFRNASTMVFYKAKEPELAWTMVRYPDLAPHADWVWLVRAFAEVRYPDLVSEYSGELRDYYARPYGDLWYLAGERFLGFPPDHVHVMGRVMVGFEPAQRLHEMSVPPALQYELAYALGLLNQCRGELREASNWYHIVAERAPQNSGEFHWAQDQLYRWYESGRLLGVQRNDCQIAKSPP